DLPAMPPHETVFAMTIHKSQGSQFKHTMIVLPARASRILTRELVYTAVTRSRSHVSLAGTREVLREALGRTVQRASTLGSLLWGRVGDPGPRSTR
ncbi:MAG TPA: ATP-dependent RecD-like DNA helicase, partial [Polyangiaceae bacterium]|nr:ATP-dependent RecD-like DNA helicase [Polyangiaceae bacterium]